MDEIKRFILIFVIIYSICLLCQSVYECHQEAIAKYVKTEIRAAVMINLKTKWMVKPEGLEA